MKNTILIALLLCGAACFSQGNASRKEIRKWKRESRQNLLIEDYLAAWQSGKKVLSATSHPPTALNCCVAADHLHYPADSLVFLKDDLQRSDDSDALYYLGRICHRQHRFDEALEHLGRYDKAAPGKKSFTNEETRYLRTQIENARKFCASPKNQQIKNMGMKINSPYPDYVPVIAPDESALYFTSKRPGAGNEKNADNNYFEDVYVSYKQNGVWQEAIPLGEPVNSPTNDACVAISSDGKSLIIYRTSKDITTGDLFISTQIADGKWSEPVRMNEKINSEYIETSACFGTDSSEIFFCSDRPGGLGGKDLYRIRRLPDGNWSEPFNLGSSINTPYDEDAPFLHPDGKTLYFSSRGHNSMGEYDVYRTTFDGELNQFSPPENLEFPINSVGNDIFFTLSVDGQRGYYSTVKENGSGNMDIYQVDTRFASTDLIAVQGIVKTGGNPGAARITLLSSDSGKVLGNYRSQEGNGKFIMILDPHQRQEIQVESDNGITKKFTLDLLTHADPEEPLIFELDYRNAQ